MAIDLKLRGRILRDLYSIGVLINTLKVTGATLGGVTILKYEYNDVVDWVDTVQSLDNVNNATFRVLDVDITLTYVQS